MVFVSIARRVVLFFRLANAVASFRLAAGELNDNCLFSSLAYLLLGCIHRVGASCIIACLSVS